MKVLGACSLGGAGHLQPLLPLLDVARARGDGTLVLAPPGLAPLAERSGHPFAAGGEPPESVISPIREALPVLPPEEASVLGNRDLFGQLATEAMLPAMARVFDEWQPDLVLREPCEYASAVVAGERGTPAVQVAISLAEVEWGSIAVAADVLESHRAGMVEELRASPYVTAFPASIDPSPFADTRRVRTRPAEPAAPLPDWWGASKAPLLYATLGSVIPRMSFAAAAFRSILAAVGELDARVLLTVGRLDPTVLQPLPDNVHVEQWVDQADAFAHAEVVICHGGSGTVLGALRAGVPMVSLPHFGDQFPNAHRIVASGAGVVLETARGDEGRPWPAGADAAARITSSITRVRTGTTFREAARRLSREMESLPTVASLLDDLGERPRRPAAAPAGRARRSPTQAPRPPP